MMLHVKTALEATTSHGVPRIVSNKATTVRFAWLLVFIVMVGLFLKGLSDFIIKLQARQVTSTLEANIVNFQFPDVYACFENPISGSYSANVDAKSANEINAWLNASQSMMLSEIATIGMTGAAAANMDRSMSMAYPQSLPYKLLVDVLGHRNEQNVITSDFTANTGYGMPQFFPMTAETFYHPMYLSCLKWKLNSTLQEKVLQSGSSAGIVITLVTDSFSSSIPSSGNNIRKIVYAKGVQIPVSDWSLSFSDFNSPDRQFGIHVFLTSPGEYPSEFVNSFSLGPGRSHTVEIGMMQHEYQADQFECLSNAEDIQFVNPYDESPYNHTYSYSYCFYYEYHRQVQNLVNTSGIINPLPWPLRGRKFAMNLTGYPTFFTFFRDNSLEIESSNFDSRTKAVCEKRRPCKTFEYWVSTSSAEWPAESSLEPFITSAVKQARSNAKVQNLSVPALDFMLSGSVSNVTKYVRNNVVKVHFKPRKILCNRIAFSIDYNLQSFISDVGGIMGIYLGMSLLTLCEALELVYDMASFGRSKAKQTKPQQVAPKNGDSTTANGGSSVDKKQQESVEEVVSTDSITDLELSDVP